MPLDRSGRIPCAGSLHLQVHAWCRSPEAWSSAASPGTASWGSQGSLWSPSSTSLLLQNSLPLPSPELVSLGLGTLHLGISWSTPAPPRKEETLGGTPKEGVPVMECGSVFTVAWDPSRELCPGLQPSAVQTQAQCSLPAASFIPFYKTKEALRKHLT